MICQAYKSNLNRLNLSDSDQYEVYNSEYYEYETESYDFRPYQSADEGGNVGVERGFNYNSSINGSGDGSSINRPRRKHKREKRNSGIYPRLRDG